MRSCFYLFLKTGDFTHIHLNADRKQPVERLMMMTMMYVCTENLIVAYGSGKRVLPNINTQRGKKIQEITFFSSFLKHAQ